MIPISLIKMIVKKKTIPQDDTLFNPDISLNKSPSISEKTNDSEEQKFELQTFHETFLSVIKQSLKCSFIVPSFFQHTPKFKESFLPLDTQLNIGTMLKNQKRDLLLKTPKTV